MERTNKHHQQYKQDKETARQQRLKTKFETKSFSAEYRAAFYIVIGATILFQFASLLTAITLPASWIHAICYNWAVGFTVAFLFLALLEVVKRLIISKAIKNAFQFGRWLSPAMFIGVLLSGASIISSTLGTPILIKEFGAAPTLQDTSTLSESHKEQVAAINAFWLPQIEQAEQDAKATHKANNWKGVTTRTARPIVLKYRQQAQNYRDSLSNALGLAAQNYRNGVKNVEQANISTIAQDKQKKANTGYILGFITFGLELLFIFCSGWKEYFDYREALELESVVTTTPTTTEEKQSDNVRPISVKKKTVQQQAKDLRSRIDANGNRMSYREIGKELGVSHMTAKRYVEA